MPVGLAEAPVVPERSRHFVQLEPVAAPVRPRQGDQGIVEGTARDAVSSPTSMRGGGVAGSQHRSSSRFHMETHRPSPA